MKEISCKYFVLIYALVETKWKVFNLTEMHIIREEGFKKKVLNNIHARMRVHRKEEIAGGI